MLKWKDEAGKRVVTQTEGADVDTTAADTRHAAKSEVEERLRRQGRQHGANAVHAETRPHQRALSVPALRETSPASEVQRLRKRVEK